MFIEDISCDNGTQITKKLKFCLNESQYNNHQNVLLCVYFLEPNEKLNFLF